jgi:hypothetical protein
VLLLSTDALEPVALDHPGMATATEHDHDELVGTSASDVREAALQRLKKRRDLKAHTVVFTLVNLAVWGIWVAVSANSGSWWPWPIFVTLFWGIGLVMNAWDVYVRKPITEQELQHEIERITDSPRD